MPPEPSFESLCFNPFLVKDSLNDTNQDPDVNFYNDISSVETSYLSPCDFSENSNANKTLFLAGDFNINVLDYENNKNVQNFVNLMFEFSMIPTINKPTRVTSYTPTAIDNIITNSILDKDFKSAIIKTDLSDHFPVIFVIKLKTMFSPKNQVDQLIFKRDFNENTITLFKQNLFETSWDSVKKIDDSNESKFLEIFSSLYEKYFPLTKVKLKPKRKNSPWITNGIAKSSKRKQKLYEKFLKHRTQESKQIYKDYKNLFEIIKRKSKKQFYSEKLIKFQGNAKKAWSIMKELIGKNKIYNSSFPQKIVIDTTEIVGETKIAKEFNNFFTNIGPKLAQKIPQPSRPFQSYMKTVNSELENKKATIIELKEAFFSLKINKSAGFDDISYNVVKNYFGELSDPLLHIFNLSFLNGIFPDSLKIAKVTPVYKAGDSSDLGNYRPISVLPCFSKILERIMYKRLYKHLQENKILYCKQFGFQQVNLLIMLSFNW